MQVTIKTGNGTLDFDGVKINDYFSVYKTDSEDWSLTHTESGFAVGFFDRKYKAVHCAMELSKLGSHWAQSVSGIVDIKPEAARVLRATVKDCQNMRRDQPVKPEFDEFKFKQQNK